MLMRASGRVDVADICLRLRRRSLTDGRSRPCRLGAYGAPLAVGRRRALAAIDAQPLQAPRIRIEHLDLEVARPGHELAAHRYAADLHEQIAAECIDLLGGVADVELGAEDRRHVLQ